MKILRKTTKVSCQPNNKKIDDAGDYENGTGSWFLIFRNHRDLEVCGIWSNWAEERWVRSAFCFEVKLVIVVGKVLNFQSCY